MMERSDLCIWIQTVSGPAGTWWPDGLGTQDAYTPSVGPPYLCTLAAKARDVRLCIYISLEILIQISSIAD